MSGGQLRKLSEAGMKRRAFISAAGVAVAGGSLLSFVSGCAGSDSGPAAPTVSKGLVRGSVVDMNGRSQSVGRLYILDENGLNTELWADPDVAGRFDFGQVEIGDYQLRYWGANLAHVPEALPNPVPITVRTAAPVDVRIQIALGAASNFPQRDIYIGDYFFQEQPSGTPNAPVVVKVGTRVCWYNVGRMVHTVTGGPWGDSGAIGHAGNYIWPATELGTFQYSCSFHRTQMVASLQVIV